jgi:hypothetical protein
LLCPVLGHWADEAEILQWRGVDGGLAAQRVFALGVAAVLLAQPPGAHQAPRLFSSRKATMWGSVNSWVMAGSSSAPVLTPEAS